MIRETQDDDSSFFKKATILIFAYFFEMTFNIALLAMALTTASLPSNICTRSTNIIQTTNSITSTPCPATVRLMPISGCYWVYIYIVLIPLMIRSVFRFVIIVKKLRETKKKMGIIPEVEYDANGKIKEPWHQQGVGPILVCSFYILKWLYFLIKLFDFRECFWQYQNYLIRSSIRYVFQVAVTSFCLTVNIWMITLSIDADSKNLQGACIAFILTRFIAVTIYFVSFELYVPKQIERAQIEIDEEAKNQIETISDGMIDQTEKPDDCKKNNTTCCFLFRKKYRPVPQFARFMRLWEVGTEGCILNDQCLSADLEHILKCHDDLNIPSRTFNCNYCCGRSRFMIGFHQTSEKSALQLALSEFRPGKNGSFGKAIYFARSINNTIGKALDAENGRLRTYMGPVICAIIDMGRIMYTHELALPYTTKESLNSQN